MYNALRSIFLIFLLANAAVAQVIVPNSAISMFLPQSQARFVISNFGEKPVVVSLDLAPRSNLYQKSVDGFVVLHPKTFRLEPKARQTVSALWRGNSRNSHYYFVRVNSVSEEELTKDRANLEHNKPLQVKVGQAFPLNIVTPNSRARLSLRTVDGGVRLVNVGTRGDFVDQIRLVNGRGAKVGKFIVPGEEVLLEGVAPSQQIASVKLRRTGWVILE